MRTTLLLFAMVLSLTASAAPTTDGETSGTGRSVQAPAAGRDRQPGGRRWQGGAGHGGNGNGVGGIGDGRFHRAMAQARQEMQRLDNATEDLGRREEELKGENPTEPNGSAMEPGRVARVREMLTLRRRLLELEKQDFADRVVRQCRSALEAYPLLDAAGQSDRPGVAPRMEKIRQAARVFREIAEGPVDYEVVSQKVRDLPVPPEGLGPGAPAPLRRKGERLSRELGLLIDQLDRVESEMGALSNNPDRDGGNAPRAAAPRRPGEEGGRAPRADTRSDAAKRLREIIDRLESSPDLGGEEEGPPPEGPPFGGPPPWDREGPPPPAEDRP